MDCFGEGGGKRRIQPGSARHITMCGFTQRIKKVSICRVDDKT